MDMHFASVWESIADAIPEKTAIVQGERRVSWREFDERSARLASELARHGIGAESKVAQYLHNAPEYLESCFAAFKLRAIPINVNWRYLDEELVYLLDNSDSEVLVFQGALGERVARVRARAPKLKALIQVDDGSPAVDGAIPYEAVIAANVPAPRIARPAGGTYMLYTGGTTGMPKGVMYDASAFCSGMMLGHSIQGHPLPQTAAEVAPAVRAIHEKEAGARVVVCCPLMHGTGLWVGAFVTFNMGGTSILLEGTHFDVDALWRTVERERATDLVIVGDAFAKPMLRALDEAAERGKPYDISSVRRIVSSGVMWTSAVKQGLLAHGDMILLDIMGSTEGGMAQSVTTRALGSETAKFQLNPTAKVFTDDGREVAPGSGDIGMLATAGNVPLGYYKDPEKSARTFRTIGGVRYSFPGDWATVEANGAITLLGRGSVCINSGGEKIFPEEVEEVVKLHPAVYDCLVVGVPDERFGEAVTAVASLRPGERASEGEVLKQAREKLSSYKLPKHVLFVDVVRRAPNGKADYKWAREHAVEALGRKA
jgi:fatty-acyl-CoA synthase